MKTKSPSPKKPPEDCTKREILPPIADPTELYTQAVEPNPNVVPLAEGA